MGNARGFRLASSDLTFVFSCLRAWPISGAETGNVRLRISHEATKGQCFFRLPQGSYRMFRLPPFGLFKPEAAGRNDRSAPGKAAVFQMKMPRSHGA